MTEKERIENAVRHIKTATDIDPWAMDLAVQALMKQLPREPVMGYAFAEKIRDRMKKINDKKSSEMAETQTDCCPICKHPLGVSQFVKAQTGLAVGKPYCANCGQAIDWGNGGL